MQNTYALVTGASQGIGLEIARLIAQDRINLILVARDDQRLQEIARQFKSDFGIEVLCLKADLSQAGAAQAVFDEVQKRALYVSILVNNAGVGMSGPFADSNPQEQEKMLYLNMQSLVRMTHLFMAPMLREGSGKIMNVASTAAFQAGPMMALYYATKAFVLSFSEAIRIELQETPVSVTTLCPGPTQSEFQKRAGLDKIKLFKEGSAVMMSSADVARQGYRAMQQGRAVVVTGTFNKLGVFMTRFIPRSWAAQIAKGLVDV